MFTWIWAWDHFSFTIALIAGAVLVGFNLPRRRRFILRVVLCLAVITGYAFVWEWVYSMISKLDLREWLKFIGLSKYFVQYLMVTLSMRICFDCNFFAALFCGTAAYCMEHISQRSYLILSLFTPEDLPFAVNALIRLAITAIIYLLVYFIVIRKNKASLSSIVVDNKIQIISSAIVICVAIVFNALAGRSASNTVLSRMSKNILTISCAFLALMLEFSILFSKKRQNEVIGLQRMLHEKTEQYEIEKANIEQINIKVHDLRHQLSALDGKIDKSEIEEISSAIDIYNCFAGSGNEAIDTIITQKSLYCQKQNIRLTCVLEGRNYDFIPAHELYALFGNAIENAINAVENLDVERRVVSIVETRQGSFATVRIMNYFGGNIEFAEGLPVTKKNKDYHGFGMKSIKLLSEKYGGTIDAQIRGDLFILSIYLPVAQKS